MLEIVGEDASFEKLGGGFRFTEGPVWHAQGRFLLFSDMPGDHMRRWSAADGVTTFRQPCNKSNGLTYDRQGRLLVCEHASSTVTRTEADGRSTVLASQRSCLSITRGRVLPLLNPELILVWSRGFMTPGMRRSVRTK